MATPASSGGADPTRIPRASQLKGGKPVQLDTVSPQTKAMVSAFVASEKTGIPLPVDNPTVARPLTDTSLVKTQATTPASGKPETDPKASASDPAKPVPMKPDDLPSPLEPKPAAGDDPDSATANINVADTTTKLLELLNPRIQDLDAEMAGYGAFWGEVHSAVHKALGCLGVVTDGSIRDIPQWAEGFQALAGLIGPSHAHVHLAGFGDVVRVAGMTVRSGDLIHADRHGAVVVPIDIADKVPAAAELCARREEPILAVARSKDFSLAGLRAALARANEIH